MLTGTGGVVLESITARLRIASSFMVQLVMRTQSQLGILRLALRDPTLGQYLMAERGYMIVSSMEVSDSRSGTILSDNCFADVAFTFDDGPYNYTSDLLDKLAVYNASATFMISKFKPLRAFE